MSRYDYRDPGQDPDYGDGLSADTDLCLWCEGPMPRVRPDDPYCSPLCARWADEESVENRWEDDGGSA